MRLHAAQALFCTSRQSVPKYGAALRDAAPRRAPFRSLIHPTPQELLERMKKLFDFFISGVCGDLAIEYPPKADFGFFLGLL